MTNRNLFKYLFLAILCIAFLCFQACKPSVDGQLQQAEQLIKNKPDSAFHILHDMQEYYAGMNDSEKALFGYLYLRIKDGKSDRDSTDINRINFSIDYYTRYSDKQRLAGCYLYKSRIFKDKMECTEAMNMLLKAKDIAEPLADHKLLAEIYFDLGHIYAFFGEQDKALEYLNLSIKSYEQCGNIKSAGRVHMVIGWLYSASQNYKDALPHTMQALNMIKDSLTTGDLLEDIGDYHLAGESYDSAYYYYHESLLYPTSATNKSIRYYNLAKLFFEIGQYDSSKVYINKALAGPIDVAYKANCYRLLVGIASETGTKKELEQYVYDYQLYQDSVNKRKKQPAMEVVEQVHQSNVENTTIKNQRLWLTIGVVTILLAGGFVSSYLYKRNKKKQQTVDFYKAKHSESEELHSEFHQQVSTYKAELKRKHDLLLAQLKQELEFTRERYADRRKKASSPQERRAIDRAIYHEVLQVDNEQAFMEKMNQLLSNLPHRLQSDYPDISYRQIVWCCLFVLDINTTDIALIMDYTPASLYKFKQRLSKKLHFENVRELEQMLYEKLGL